jgi:hypothetical protein
MSKPGRRSALVRFGRWDEILAESPPKEAWKGSDVTLTASEM